MPTNVSKQCCSWVNIDELTTNITKLTQEVTQLKNQINQLKEKETSIESRVHENENCCEETNERIDQQNSVIGEQANNITVLKNLHVINKKAIEWLEKKVIIDDEYLNFQEWVENVYIPQCDQIVNKYSEWDIYINVNQDVAATNATYVNIKNKNSNEPCSANDWQELYYSAPADVLTILWIDPVKVTHPYKHEWVVSIDPNRLADMISQLRSLDLSKVEVSLDKVYFTPTFTEDAHFTENVEVDNELKTKRIEAKEWHIEHLCVDEFTCDINTPYDIDANKVKAKVVDSDTINSEHNYFGDTHFHWPTVFEDSITYINNEDHKPICIDNVMKNTFKPSYGLFMLHGSLYTPPVQYATHWQEAQYGTYVFGIWSDSIDTFNRTQTNPVPLISINSGMNNTYLTWDQENQTRNVYLDSSDGAIKINGSGDDAGIYQITMHMTAFFSPAPDREVLQNVSVWKQHNFAAHRAWVVIYSPEHPGGLIFDDKHHGTVPSISILLKGHHHPYFDANDGKYASGSRTRATSEMYFGKPWEWGWWVWWWDWATNWDWRQRLRWDWDTFVNTIMSADNNTQAGIVYCEPKFDHYYTYSISCAYPVDKLVTVAPFFKPSSSMKEISCSGRMTITEGEWVTWAQSQIFIHKIANLGVPDEYHCQ